MLQNNNKKIVIQFKSNVFFLIKIKYNFLFTEQFDFYTTTT